MTKWYSVPDDSPPPDHRGSSAGDLSGVQDCQPGHSVVGYRRDENRTCIYHYFGIDRDAVWNVVEHDLPALKEQLLPLIQE